MSKKNKTKLLVLTSFFFGICLISNEVFSNTFKDNLSKIDRKLATFDPGGKYLKQPFEKKIPKAQISGFLKNWSDFLLEENGVIGSHNQNNRFLQLQNLAEVEVDYNIAQGIDVKAIAHMLYDGVYDWQGGTGLSADSSDRSAELYHDGERVLRELYISYRKSWLDFRIGKQQLAWGKMDGQFIDIVNGMDRREFVQLESDDYEIRRLPTWMANSTFYFGKNTLQLLYVFDFEQDRLPGLHSPWASPLLPASSSDLITRSKRPQANNFSDHEYGIRLDRTSGALSYGFVYMYAWDKNPINKIIGTTFVDGDRVLNFESRHERIHHLGFTADYATTFSGIPLVGSLPTVFRIEALYSNGVRVTDARKQRAARNSGIFSDGISRHDTVRAAVALELALPQRTTFMFQPSWYQTLNHKEGLGPAFGGGLSDEWSFIPVLYLTRPFAFSKDRMSADLTLYPVISGSDTGWGGIKTKFGINYKFSNFIKGRLTLNRYDGGSDSDFYGQYNRWDNIGWELSYEF